MASVRSQRGSIGRLGAQILKRFGHNGNKDDAQQLLPPVDSPAGQRGRPNTSSGSKEPARAPLASGFFANSSFGLGDNPALVDSPVLSPSPELPRFMATNRSFVTFTGPLPGTSRDDASSPVLPEAPRRVVGFRLSDAQQSSSSSDATLPRARRNSDEDTDHRAGLSKFRAAVAGVIADFHPDNGFSDLSQVVSQTMRRKPQAPPVELPSASSAVPADMQRDPSSMSLQAKLKFFQQTKKSGSNHAMETSFGQAKEIVGYRNKADKLASQYTHLDQHGGESYRAYAKAFSDCSPNTDIPVAYAAPVLDETGTRITPDIEIKRDGRPVKGVSISLSQFPPGSPIAVLRQNFFDSFLRAEAVFSGWELVVESGHDGSELLDHSKSLDAQLKSAGEAYRALLNGIPGDTTDGRFLKAEADYFFGKGSKGGYLTYALEYREVLHALTTMSTHEVLKPYFAAAETEESPQKMIELRYRPFLDVMRGASQIIHSQCTANEIVSCRQLMQFDQLLAGYDAALAQNSDVSELFGQLKTSLAGFKTAPELAPFHRFQESLDGFIQTVEDHFASDSKPGSFTEFFVASSDFIRDPQNPDRRRPLEGSPFHPVFVRLEAALDGVSGNFQRREAFDLFIENEKDNPSSPIAAQLKAFMLTSSAKTTIINALGLRKDGHHFEAEFTASDVHTATILPARPVIPVIPVITVGDVPNPPIVPNITISNEEGPPVVDLPVDPPVIPPPPPPPPAVVPPPASPVKPVVPPPVFQYGEGGLVPLLLKYARLFMAVGVSSRSGAAFTSGSPAQPNFVSMMRDYVSYLFSSSSQSVANEKKPEAFLKQLKEQALGLDPVTAGKVTVKQFPAAVPAAPVVQPAPPQAAAARPVAVEPDPVGEEDDPILDIKGLFNGPYDRVDTVAQPAPPLRPASVLAASLVTPAGGIGNTGSTCYLNSALQMMVRLLPDLTPKPTPDRVKLDLLRETVRKINDKSLTHADIEALYAGVFGDGNLHIQQDSSEILLKFLELFEPLINLQTSVTPYSGLQVGVSSLREESQSIINIAVPITGNPGPPAKLSAHILNQNGVNQSVEMMSGRNQYRDVADVLVDAGKTQHLVPANPDADPSVVFFNLKRFTAERQKIGTPVKVDPQFNMEINGQMYQFTLVSGVVHNGPSIRGGHYQSFAQHDGQPGYTGFNDDAVSHLTTPNGVRDLEIGGYVFAYKMTRVGEAVALDAPSSLLPQRVVLELRPPLPPTPPSSVDKARTWPPVQIPGGEPAAAPVVSEPAPALVKKKVTFEDDHNLPLESHAKEPVFPHEPVAHSSPVIVAQSKPRSLPASLATADAYSHFTEEKMEAVFAGLAEKTTTENKEVPSRYFPGTTGFYRYANVQAPKATMVKADGYPANFVDPGHNIIACEGPRSQNTAAFWDMLWDNNTSAIAMLTNPVEKRVDKCAEYWKFDNSSETTFPSGLTVKLNNTVLEDGTTVRNFTLTKGNEERSLAQFHYTTWPDHGVPGDGDVEKGAREVMRFNQQVRTYLKAHPAKGTSGPGPLVVHCSAGVGRTGTYLAVDHAQAQLESSGSLEGYKVDKTVTDLRKARGALTIQTPAQYQLVCKAACLIATDPLSAE